jgi:phosphatidylserine/phosphatidylglycerophosphate/cardiolipin synthase-like enzyme
VRRPFPRPGQRVRLTVDVRTLTDGGQSALEIAEYAGEFISAAEETLDLALYDFDLEQPTAKLVASALAAAAQRGVAVRLAYNFDHANPIPVPPPPRAEPSLIESLEVPTMAIPGIPDLMHHKYAVRDRRALWTGSTNWTDDSWSREENVIVVAESEPLAHAYATDFEQLWSSGAVAESGFVDPDPVRVDGMRVRAWFAPGHGEAMATRIAHRIKRAKRTIRMSSPVITSGPILGALAEVVSDGKVDVAGVVDATQMKGVYHQWSLSGNASWKMPLIERALGGAPFSGKGSTPYGQGDVHDYMHAKVTVTDDYVFTGSFNLSHSGEVNAENVLELRDADLAERLGAFVDHVRGLYPAAPLPGGNSLE